ncbi:bifunctional methylenetetrahydrofolate dehydrogenase/methenyltetrahydrofolate cyclohydrolase FolD [Acidaminobacter sp. JC074]|uniref:bifunctional methylenetetrahydrofolate dehydrogenase/methenyltetrahydrofolate cyclohydrolase FolD n=1 Tax=Acidaminobacter sp. JC074 TaxID=2530199 RepID=UPI001F0F1418|nr:bifunctional methylenetetrahydrofolate dehydrogenase/methenyltetrahydrofolate cyclohydrolase FolD [Acidaminobacter sp. JC074]MCH4890736.1 bifunctional methylenetetrahydrofolate dehydrogenase/methenyltetrahydrofolate cyclohydrolase FolD [Acidaminobacter sp. JC074]
MIIDGKKVSQIMREDMKKEVEALKEKGFTPGLAVVIVGENPASQSYVNSKQKTCNALGMYSEKHELSADTSEEALLKLIDDLNADSKIHGILVQLPLPGHLDESKVIERIDPKKDVDGFHPINVGNLSIGFDGLKPCTPYGVIKLLDHYDIQVEGKHAVVLGRSNIVGKPVSMMLLQKNATVTVCHSRTENLNDVLKTADIIVVAIGRPGFLTQDMVKEGAVVIDVGINRVDGKIVGDVKYDEVSKLASHITPVPGGVGPMTITMLMYNTLKACKENYFDA